MDVYDIQSLEDYNKYYMNESVLNFMIPNVYRLFLNITIQHVCHRFNHGLRSTFFEFERDIDEYIDEINAYILQFITKSDTPIKREKQPIEYIKATPSGKMCNIPCHIYFPIKDIFNKTSCPIKNIYYL